MVKLGCDKETLTTMIEGGGRCAYERGSQLAEAVAFLEAHPSSVAYISISIGANDATACTRSGVLDVACAADTFERAPRDLATIVSALRAAAGPEARIAGMTLYNPWLNNWLQDEQQQAVREITGLTEIFNSALADSYLNNGAMVADVAAAFATADFETLVEMADGRIVPLNVARICAWTYRCAPPPVGPNIHPNPDGYQVIANVFAATLLDAAPLLSSPPSHR
jgi:lysophospholipase L1-like esterase